MTRPVFSLEIAVELRHGELSSCAIHTLNTCNLLSTRPRAASDWKKKQVESPVRPNYRVYGTIPDEPWRHRLQFDIRYQRQPFPCTKSTSTGRIPWTAQWRIGNRQPSTSSSNC